MNSFFPSLYLFPRFIFVYVNINKKKCFPIFLFYFVKHFNSLRVGTFHKKKPICELNPFRSIVQSVEGEVERRNNVLKKSTTTMVDEKYFAFKNIR